MPKIKENSAAGRASVARLLRGGSPDDLPRLDPLAPAGRHAPEGLSFQMRGLEVRRHQRRGARLQGAREARIEDLQSRQAGRREVEECEAVGGGPGRL